MKIQELPEKVVLEFPLGLRNKDYFAVIHMPYRWKMDDMVLRVDTLGTDGASIPGIAKVFTGDSFSTTNLYPAIPHDAAYNAAIVAELGNESVPVYLTPSEADAMFRAIRDKAGGRDDLNFWEWCAIRANSLLDPFRRKRTYPTWEQFKRRHPNGVRYSDIAKP